MFFREAPYNEENLRQLALFAENEPLGMCVRVTGYRTVSLAVSLAVSLGRASRASLEKGRFDVFCGALCRAALPLALAVAGCSSSSPSPPASDLIAGDTPDASLARTAPDSSTPTKTTPADTVSGSVTGLAGTGLVLEETLSGPALTVSANGSFMFPAEPDASAYAISVKDQPAVPSQTCTVTNGSGVVAAGGVTGVSVVCATNSFTVGGTLPGLAGTGLVLDDNGANALSVPPETASFTFAMPLLSGSAYSVTIASQPSSPTQTCTVTSGSGTVTSAAVTSVVVTCQTASYSITGTVTGLGSATGLVLQDSNNEDLTIPGDGPFAFPRPVTDGSYYAVTVAMQPLSLTCTVTDPPGGSGKIDGAEANVTVTCM
jgi:hypothetical protein